MKDNAWLIDFLSEKFTKKKISMRSFSKIKSKAQKESKFTSDKDLRRSLVYCGAIKFQTRNNDKEFWGLVTENYKKLGFTDKTLIDSILNEMKSNARFMPKYLAQIILVDPRYSLRKFSTISNRLAGFEDNEIRRILVFAGALRFTIGGKEYWGLASRNLNLLGFSEKQRSDKIIESIETNKTEKFPYLLAEILLEHPVFYRRTFRTITQKLGGFSEDEIRSILFEVGALPFRDKNDIEYWGLKKRNKKLLKDLGWTD